MKAARARRGVIQQAAECFQSDSPPTDMLMTVEFRTACGLGVITMPDGNTLQTYRLIQTVECIFHPSWAHDVVTSDVSVASIDARPHRNHVAQVFQDFGNLFEAAPERVFRSACIFNQDGKTGLG